MVEDKLDRYLQNVKRDRIDALRESSTKQKAILAFIRAELEKVPVIGGLFANLLEEFHPDRQMERLISFVEDLSRDFERLQRQVKQDRILTDEFDYLLSETLAYVQRDYQQEKRDAYRAILLNALVVDDFVAGESEIFLSMVQELTAPHIQMLRLIHRPKESAPDGWHHVKQTSEIQITGRNILYSIYQNAVEGYIDAIWAALNARGLVENSWYEQKHTLIQQHALGTETDFRDLILDQITRGSLTRFGLRFIQFITSPSDAQSAGE